MFLGIFRDLFKLLNRKIVPLYLWLFLYAFILTIDDNFFICSYLRDEVFGKDENTFLVLVFYVIYSLLSFYINRLKKKNSNNRYSTLYTQNILIEIMKLRYKFYVIKFAALNHLLNFNFKKLNLFTIFLSNNYKSYKINTLFIFLYSILNNKLILWYPIFKTYSIFGFYKSTRLNFIDIKNENLKRLKY